EDMRTAYGEMQQRLQAKAKAAFDKAAAENKTRSTSFLAENKAKSGVKSLADGVQYRVLEVGNGAKPTPASTVELEVAGPYPWGQRPNPAQPAQKMSATKVSEIARPAIREVVAMMPEGSRWDLPLPPEKAFGNDPRSPFPPKVAVVFGVKVLSVR